MNFFKSLFDFNFSSYITTKLVKVIYILSIIFTGLAVVSYGVMAAMSGEPLLILLWLLGAPFFFLIYVCLARIYLEIVVVIFRIAEDVSRLAQFELVAEPEESQL